MKKEIRDMKKENRVRISELTKEIAVIQGKNSSLLKQGQDLQQQIARNNTVIIRKQGAIEELEKQIA